jgi:hypothetical protein
MTSCVIMLWYRSPKLLLDVIEYGVVVNLWSTMCILVEMLAGISIMLGQTEIEQPHKIFKLGISWVEDY